MTKTVWITRTQPSADDSVQAWEAKGYAAIAAPLLRVIHPPETPCAPSQKTVLVFTSKNGVFAFQGYGFAPRHKVITVGDATAAAARAAGFTDVTSAQGRSADVAALILKTVSKTTPIIHCGGRHIRGSIAQDLNAAGYSARRDLYYQSEAVTAWPVIDYAALTHIAFYSPLAAKTFCALTLESLSAEVSLDIHKLQFICISEATNAALDGMRGDFASVQRQIANTPDEATMLMVADCAKVKDI